MAKMVKFKQAVHLLGKDFALNSQHMVSEEMAKDPYFMKLVGLGLVVEAGKPVISSDTMAEKQAKLADAILGVPAEKVEEPQMIEMVAEVELAEESHEEIHDEEFSPKNKSKKSKK